MYSFRTTLHRPTGDPVELAFTDRHGGVSGVPFETLNLSAEGGDDPVACARNVELVHHDLAPGAVLADLHQVHGCAVVYADPDPDRPRPRADALVTDRPGLVLMVRAADCVPVLFADPAAAVVGAAHCGRTGLAAGVVPETIAALRDLGATHLTAWIGPHVCGTCYEVPEEMRADVGAVVPAAVATTSWGTPSLDLAAGVRSQLAEAGVAVVDAGCCTRESPDLYSYRRDGRRSGRLAGMIAMLS